MSEDGSECSGETSAEPRVSRRRLLRAGVNLGASAALVFGVGADYVTSEDVGTITYALARSEPGSVTLEPRTKEVPAAWHERLQLAFEAQAKIREAGLEPLVGSFVVPGNYDDPEASLSVDATEEGVLETLEDLTGDVPVEVNVFDELPPSPDSESDPLEGYRLPVSTPQRVPGGVLCQGNERFGTLTPALFDADGARFFATSNHVFGAGGTKETEHRGEPLVLPHHGGSTHVGDVVRGYPAADVVRAAPIDEFRPVPEIARASPSTVVGQFTRFGLADVMARERPLVKIGAISDRTTGHIQGVDGVTCYTGEACKTGQLKWGDETTLTNGDSGSVNFRPDPEQPEKYLLVGGINNARTWWPGADFTWGTAAHHLRAEYGLHF